MTSYLLSQFGYQAPMLLVCLVAFVLALMNIGRARVPSILALIGACTLIVTAIGVAVIQAALIESRTMPGSNHENVHQLMTIVGVAGSCIRAVGLGLWVAAIFAGRANDDGQGYRV